VIGKGVPRFGPRRADYRNPTPTSPQLPSRTPAPSPTDQDTASPSQAGPVSDPLMETPLVKPTPSPSTIAAARQASPPARPVVRRSRAWRWFGWFRQRPVGHGKPEQIELRLEDVRPLRSSLEGEDFVVVKNPTNRPVTLRRNPFVDASAAPPPVAEKVTPAPTQASAVESGPMNRLARWFRNRETTALK
jgi:hypothetical protein